MAGRIRTIKPELLEDERTAGLSDAAWRLFVSAILLADDHGNLRASPRFLRSAIWWAHDDKTVEQTAEAIREVAASGILDLYSVREQFYAHVHAWEKHQRVDNAGRARVPGMSDGIACDSDGILRLSESRGESPRIAALPPTSDPDHRPPTTDHENAPSGAPGSDDPGLAPTPPAAAPAPTPPPEPPQPSQPPEPPPVATTEDPKARQAREAFEHYLAGWHRTIGGARPPKLDDKRRRAARARLAEGFTLDDLKAACDGLWASAWHVENGRTDFGLVVRDAAHVEQFRDRTGAFASRRGRTGSLVQPAADRQWTPPEGAGF